MSGGAGSAAVRGFRRRWFGVVLLGTAGALVGYLLLVAWWTRRHGGWWLLVAGGVAAAELAALRWWLAREIRRGGGPAPTLGVANLLTVLRGLLLAAVAGFLPLGRPAGWELWVPAGLYGAAVALDVLDGAVARRVGEVTRLGAALDETFDTVGLFVAPALAVAYGQLPPWYLAVPLAKPAYLGTLRLWRRSSAGGELRELPPSRLRRPLASLQMVVTAAALSPLVGPPATTVLGTAAVVPFLAVFARDWLAVTGLLDR